MPEWNSSEMMAYDHGVFTKVVFVCLGIYIWEILNSLDYEWSLLSRRRPWKWPLLSWIVCRYSCLIMLIIHAFLVTSSAKINCLSATQVAQLMANVAIGCATLLLMLRTFAVWGLDKRVVIPCCIASLGHWTLLAYDTTAMLSSWDETLMRCLPTPKSSPFLLAAPYVYTITFDLIILCLTTAGLIINSPDSRGSHLWHLLFTDGLAFFVIVTVANVLPTIFILLELNALMNLVFTVPAAAANAIVATRLVVRLSDYVSRDTLYVSPATQKSLARASILGGGNSLNSASSRMHRKSSSLVSSNQHGGVQITMETFTETHAAHVRPQQTYPTSRSATAGNAINPINGLPYGTTSNGSTTHVTFASVRRGNPDEDELAKREITDDDDDDDEKKVTIVMEEDDVSSSTVNVTVIQEKGGRMY